jgi:hypothetical protein
MQEITEEQMNFLRTLLITPSFFVQNHTMTPLNEAGTALHLSYEEIQAYLPNDMDTIALQQISFSHGRLNAVESLCPAADAAVTDCHQELQ